MGAWELVKYEGRFEGDGGRMWCGAGCCVEGQGEGDQKGTMLPEGRGGAVGGGRGGEVEGEELEWFNGCCTAWRSNHISLVAAHCQNNMQELRGEVLPA
jgi:hypothetical protein